MREISTQPGPVVKLLSFRIATERAPQFIDITDEVQTLVAESGVSHGTATVFCRHTTAAIRINENEPLLLSDMEEFLKRVAPRELYYRHNDFSIRTENMTEDECPNAHAHCQHLMLGASETIPIVDGRLTLGRWQRVFLVELDRPREREVCVQIIGC
ncbi:TPA: YjbQ family protein [Candidatus Bipolaricaulota bacterium]|nr:YjbQ family protein [Candidatus Bipolaricaulota bacterium]HIP99962.1 YjbQ family protein [Candidatus Bipolaricaulota bacterium]